MTGDELAARMYHLEYVRVHPAGIGLCDRAGEVNAGRNSGYQAINYAYHLGARKIVLVGFDMQHTGGKTHWHGDHPKGLTNAGGIVGWVPLFAPLAKHLEALGVDVVNCSEQTALTCFRRGKLTDEL